MKLSKRKPPFEVQAFLRRAEGGGTIAKYRKNHRVFVQGDTADAVFYIQKGKVKLSVTSQRGKEAVVALLGEGDFFGEGCLVGQPLRISTATTLSEASLMRLKKAEVVRLLQEESSFAGVFITHLVSRNIRIEADLVDQLFNSSEKRLARVLLLLANLGNEDRKQKLVPKISQETLAEIIGTTRSRVNFFMNRFRKMGFIDYDGGIEVHNSLLGVVLHD